MLKAWPLTCPTWTCGGINSYRGTETTGFDDLFSTFEAASEKALLVTEYGCPASTRNAQGQLTELPLNADAQAKYIAAHWKDIEQNNNIASGGYVFEWTDEWWKVPHTASTHDAGSASNGAFPGGWDDEEYFGINGVKVNGRSAADPWNPGQPNAADKLLPRTAVATLKDPLAINRRRGKRPFADSAFGCFNLSPVLGVQDETT